jgi:hypothetical protein
MISNKTAIASLDPFAKISYDVSGAFVIHFHCGILPEEGAYFTTPRFEVSMNSIS